MPQFTPVYPMSHAHEKPPRLSSAHVPPFKHRFEFNAQGNSCIYI